MFQNVSSYFDSAPVGSVARRWTLAAGSQQQRMKQAGPVPQAHMALMGPSAGGDGLVQCWWECGPACLSTLQTFPREQRPRQPAHLTRFLHTQQPVSNCGWERKGQTIGGKQGGLGWEGRHSRPANYSVLPRPERPGGGKSEMPGGPCTPKDGPLCDPNRAPLTLKSLVSRPPFLVVPKVLRD